MYSINIITFNDIDDAVGPCKHDSWPTGCTRLEHKTLA